VALLPLLRLPPAPASPLSTLAKSAAHAVAARVARTRVPSVASAALASAASRGALLLLLLLLLLLPPPPPPPPPPLLYLEKRSDAPSAVTPCAALELASAMERSRSRSRSSDSTCCSIARISPDMSPSDMLRRRERPPPRRLLLSPRSLGECGERGLGEPAEPAEPPSCGDATKGRDENGDKGLGVRRGCAASRALSARLLSRACQGSTSRLVSATTMLPPRQRRCFTESLRRAAMRVVAPPLLSFVCSAG